MQVDTALVRQGTGTKDHNGNGWSKLFHPKYRDRTLVGVTIMFFQRALLFSCEPTQDIYLTIEWSGINALLYYGPTLLRSIGLNGDKVTLLVSGGIGIVQAIAVIPAILYLDKWGASFLLADGLRFIGCRPQTSFERYVLVVC
jgi:hypothetical protein